MEAWLDAVLVGSVLQFAEQDGACPAQFPVLRWHDVANGVDAAFAWQGVEDVVDSGRESVVDADHFCVDVEHDFGAWLVIRKMVNKS